MYCISSILYYVNMPAQVAISKVKLWKLDLSTLRGDNKLETIVG